MIAVTEKLAWYVSRASGVVAWAMVAASIIWGITLSSRLLKRRGIPAWLLDLHRYLAALAVVFTVVHLAGLVFDNFVYYGWKELFIPMYSDWKPGPTAWGIVAFYVLLAVEITSLLMRKIPRKYWHAVHLTAYPLFILGTVHGFQAGTDRSNKVLQWTALAIIELVVGLTLFRALTFTPRKRKAKAAAAAASSSSNSSSTPVPAQ